MLSFLIGQFVLLYHTPSHFHPHLFSHFRRSSHPHRFVFGAHHSSLASLSPSPGLLHVMRTFREVLTTRRQRSQRFFPVECGLRTQNT